jgi:hypothetical protein
MSRLTKYNFGPLGVNSGGAGNYHVGPKIPVDAAGFDTKIQITEESTPDVYIVKQKGARRFKVQHTEDGDTKVCKLVNKSYDDSSAILAGEMVIVGYYNGAPVRLRKLNNRTCADFNGNRYKWSLSDDSTTSVITLTAITY